MFSYFLIPHKTRKNDYITPEWMNSMAISSLKELRNDNGKLFCVCHKIKQKHNQHFQLLLLENTFTLGHIKLNIYI